MIMEYLTNPFMAYAEIPPFTREDLTSYGPARSTYWADFRVCGGDEKAIRDTYKNALLLAKDDKVYGTELAITLNWLMWGYADTHEDTAKIFQELWQEFDQYVMDNWTGDDLQYYLAQTD